MRNLPKFNHLSIVSGRSQAVKERLSKLKSFMIVITD